MEPNGEWERERWRLTAFPEGVVSLKVGEYRASAEPIILQALLGSNVGVALFDPKVRVGGMNHILLPGKSPGSCTLGPGCYGANAMDLLLSEMESLGASRGHLKAKIFGGACRPKVGGDAGSSGNATAEFLKGLLEKLGIPILEEKTGGIWPRLVKLETGTFQTRVGKLRLTNGEWFFHKIGTLFRSSA